MLATTPTYVLEFDQLPQIFHERPICDQSELQVEEVNWPCAKPILCLNLSEGCVLSLRCPF